MPRSNDEVETRVRGGFARVSEKVEEAATSMARAMLQLMAAQKNMLGFRNKAASAAVGSTSSIAKDMQADNQASKELTKIQDVVNKYAGSTLHPQSEQAEASAPETPVPLRVSRP